MKQETFTDIEYTFRLYAMFTCANLYALAIAGRKLSTTCYNLLQGKSALFREKEHERLHFAAISYTSPKISLYIRREQDNVHDSEAPKNN